MKNVKLILILLTIGYCLICFSCGDLFIHTLPKYSFSIQNNSKDTLNYLYSTSYPDTSLLPILDTSLVYHGTSILSIQDTSLIYPNTKHLIEIPKYLFPNFSKEGTIEIFLFNIGKFQNYTWNTIVSNYLIEKRYDLTFDSLKRMNNTIIYP